MGEMRNANTISVGKRDGKRPLVDIVVDEKIILKLILEK
jgi:hypothetical protein